MPGQALLLFALVASVQAADAGQTGRIAGSVEDPTGGRIANAAVSLADPSTGLRRRTRTVDSRSATFRTASIARMGPDGFAPPEQRVRLANGATLSVCLS
jgi:hypothetical protein